MEDLLLGTRNLLEEVLPGNPNLIHGRCWTSVSVCCWLRYDGQQSHSTSLSKITLVQFASSWFILTLHYVFNEELLTMMFRHLFMLDYIKVSFTWFKSWFTAKICHHKPTQSCAVDRFEVVPSPLRLVLFPWKNFSSFRGGFFFRKLNHFKESASVQSC